MGELVMPFRSEKQRRFLWSQHPDIAKKWTKEHGSKIVPSKKGKKKKHKKKTEEGTILETNKVDEILSMIKIPRNEYDLACPHCKEVMREKDFSFKWVDGKKWTHKCNPNKPFLMPINESYGCASSKSGFSKEETNLATPADKAKVDEIMNNKELPEVAEEGKAYVVKWADGRGIFACKKKSYLPKWLEKTGDWAEIISIKYEDPEDLKVVNESVLEESLRLTLTNIFFKE